MGGSQPSCRNVLDLWGFFCLVSVLCLHSSGVWEEQLSQVREGKGGFIGSVKALLCGTGPLVTDSIYGICESEIQTM